MNRSNELQRAISKGLRDRETDSEALLWPHLRDRRMLGIKFRRQRPLDRFWVDFCADDLKIAVEVDGGIHDDPERAHYDRDRQVYLESMGYLVIRVRAEEVEFDIKSAIARIRDAIRERQADQGYS